MNELTRRLIQPRFIASTGLEPTIRSANSNVEDEVECLIEWSRVGSSCPRVLQYALLIADSDSRREIASLEKRFFVESQVERFLESVIDIDPSK